MAAEDGTCSLPFSNQGRQLHGGIRNDYQKKFETMITSIFRVVASGELEPYKTGNGSQCQKRQLRLQFQGGWNGSDNQAQRVSNGIVGTMFGNLAQSMLYPQVRQVGLSSISHPAPMSGNPNGSWFNAPSLLIPYRDIDGRLLSVQARYLGKVEREGEGKGSGEGNPSPSPLNLPRFQFPRGSRCGIFNLPILKTLSEGSELWITEGVTDCLAMMSSGRKAIAIPSATLLKPKDLEVLLSLSLNIAPDNDAPGDKLFQELHKLLPNLQHHLLPAKYKDFGEYWKEHPMLKC